VAVWNQPDAELRRQAIRDLWTDDGAHILQPPQEIRKPRDNADRLRDVVKFNWEMVPAAGGDAAAAGLEILVLDDDGRITADYQFIEG
jgi:hypothetical protein